MKYSIDTSAILEGWRRSYPPQNFPIVWEKLDALITEGDLIATEEVLTELEKKDDEVFSWVSARDGMFIPIDDKIQIEVATILKQYPRLLDTRKNRSGADPFVIALAKIENCTVVTNEPKTNSVSRPNIPDVCSGVRIRTLTLLQLIQEQGWVFRR